MSDQASAGYMNIALPLGQVTWVVVVALSAATPQGAAVHCVTSSVAAVSEAEAIGLGIIQAKAKFSETQIILINLTKITAVPTDS